MVPNPQQPAMASSERRPPRCPLSSPSAPQHTQGVPLGPSSTIKALTQPEVLLSAPSFPGSMFLPCPCSAPRAGRNPSPLRHGVKGKSLPGSPRVPADVSISALLWLLHRTLRPALPQSLASALDQPRAQRRRGT